MRIPYVMALLLLAGCASGHGFEANDPSAQASAQCTLEAMRAVPQPLQGPADNGHYSRAINDYYSACMSKSG